MSTEIKFSVLKKPDAVQPGVLLFSVVRNEMYFLPHLLRHYREMGVHEFWFLDDHSTDGTREFLLAQSDCGVFQSNRTFGDKVGKQRFGPAARAGIPHNYFQGRWVLTVDADEFLLLPQPFASLGALVAALGREGLKVARALMLDFYPASLQALVDAPAERNPFELCPFFDALGVVDWPDRMDLPREVSALDGVRPRMLARLCEKSPSSIELRDLLRSYKLANVTKVPLLFWQADTRMLSAHRSNELPSDRIQLVLAHFKFYPGYRARIAAALATNSHWNNSMEYRFLDLATRELEDWPMQGARSRRFNSSADLEAAGLMYSRLEAGTNGS